MSSNVNSKVINATKWSAITEIVAKLVAPITTMVLARLLTPDAFGVLVTATMVISFAEIFTDAGFQKYLIQHEFDDEESLYRSTAVAFWTNLICSFFLWIIICIFSSQIAYLVGNKGYGLVIAVSCICIPLEAFSSIQMALFRRKFDFKTLFIARILGISVPLIITIPLAYYTRSYWSLIIGMIALNVSNAVILTLKSEWKPKWFYKITLLKEMISFTIWSMIEAVSIWLTSYLDVFIVGTILSTTYMGIYRVSIQTVGALMAIITSATTPVLFSALSRLQNNEGEFKMMFFKFQKTVALLVIPMGVGIFLYRDFITDVLLGDKWNEASYFIGWWGLTSALTIVLSHYASEVYRAKGLPKLSVLSQFLHLCFLIPTVLISVRYGFDTLCLNRSLVRLTLIFINMILLFRLVKIGPIEMLNNIWHTLFSCLIMCGVCVLLPKDSSLLFQILSIILCSLAYLIGICLFKEERGIIINYRNILRKNENTSSW